MKKGFTMIELIFVIVILGILASVAIPRLAGTREDAEISTAVANLRTLVSDANVYYVTKGDLKTKGSTTVDAKWSEITSVPLVNGNNAADAIDATDEAKLKVGGEECIGVTLVEKTTGANATPAHIKFTKKQPATGQTEVAGICGKVQGSDQLKAYLEAKIPNVTVTNGGAIPIGSTTKIY